MRELIFEHITDGNLVYMDCLNLILGDTPRTSFLDIGCNLAPHTPLLGFEKRKYIDALQRELDHKGEQQYFEKVDVFDMNVYGTYEVAFALDLIEHLKVDNGIRLIYLMQFISGKQILFTPLDDIFGMDYVTDNPESHKSLWKPEIVEEYFPNEFIFLTFPNYHRVYNGGAFFFWSINNGDMDKEFERIKTEIKKFSWARQT